MASMRQSSILRSFAQAAKCRGATLAIAPAAVVAPPQLHRRALSPVSVAPGRQFSAAPASMMPMPFIYENTAGGWHTYDIFSRLLRERIITLSGGVDDDISSVIVAQLLFLEADNPDKPIHLYINSPGGSVTSGMAIYDTMNFISCPVSTICVGQAASMGSLLLAGGEKGRRYALPHSSIMLHQPSGGYHGQATDIAIHAKEILRVRETLNKIYQKHLTKPHSLSEIEKIMERDLFMSAEDALEMGIVDEILTTRPTTGSEANEKKDGPPGGTATTTAAAADTPVPSPASN